MKKNNDTSEAVNHRQYNGQMKKNNDTSEAVNHRQCNGQMNEKEQCCSLPSFSSFGIKM